ncbi:hypothetical protein L289_3321 [Acinetobacter gerneri DSM 14967 = CIP 107464 = MTCC 9824]|nr:hypothetical protein L289_3321 [Acinetobacter gerneri DSM 14967 = CIP 107464 = MTCC 9824]
MMSYFDSWMLSNKEHGMCDMYFLPEQFLRTSTLFHPNLY